MSALMSLVRPDLRAFAGYRSARLAGGEGDAWLNANEAAYPNPADPDGAVRRYPEPQPAALRQALAALYGVDPSQLLACRGSDEAIDLLVRALCRPGRDRVLTTPPTFGMYAVCATLHGCETVEVPLHEGRDEWSADFAAIEREALQREARIVFLCSPGNPTGQRLPIESIAALAQALQGRALVVVDEAYGEYAGDGSAASLLQEHENIAVLRTLSKAHALAAARLGCVLAAPDLIEVLRRCQAPYPVPAPVASLALAALQPDALAQTRARALEAARERDAMYERLCSLRTVRRVYRSDANFLLLRLDDAGNALAALQAAGVVARDLRAAPGLGDALRITVGTPGQNARVLRVLEALA